MACPITQGGHNQQQNETRMWVDAQCDGRPAKSIWCPLFNAVDQTAKIMNPRCETR